MVDWVYTGFVIAITFVASFAYASYFEWTLHRYLMHRRWRIFSYPFKTHTLTHHRVFKDDFSYHLQHEEDKPLITFAWWNAPVLLAVNAPLLWVMQILTGAPVLIAGLLAMATYYALYEYLHYCMHLPLGRWFEKTFWFRWIDEHHRGHHRFQDRNLNVVLPLADLTLRTVARRLARAVEPAPAPEPALVGAGAGTDAGSSSPLSDDSRPR